MPAAIDSLKIYEHVATKDDLQKLKLELQAEIEKTKASVILWMAGMLVAQAGLITALMKLMS